MYLCHFTAQSWLPVCLGNAGRPHKVIVRKLLSRQLIVLRGSASPVLTATGFGRWQFSTPTESRPLNRSPKVLVQVITLAASTAVQHLVQTRPWGLLGKWVKYNENCIYLFIYLFIYTFFHELTCRSDPSTDFHA